MNQTMKMTVIGSLYTHLLGVLKVSIVLIKHDLFYICRINAISGKTQ